MLHELRFVQLGMRSCKSLFASLSSLTGFFGRGLLCAASSIGGFVLEWRNGSMEALAYLGKWEGNGRSQHEMAAEFQKAYPKAARNHERTSSCAPGLPQFRPEPFLWEEVMKTGMRFKHNAKAQNSPLAL